MQKKLDLRVFSIKTLRNGQITIPISIRRDLGIEEGDILFVALGIMLDKHVFDNAEVRKTLEELKGLKPVLGVIQ